MNPEEVIEVLINTEDGEIYIVRPQHGPMCTKGKSIVTSAFTCDGCKFDVCANELIALHRPQLSEPFTSAEAANYENN